MGRADGFQARSRARQLTEARIRAFCRAGGEAEAGPGELAQEEMWRRLGLARFREEDRPEHTAAVAGALGLLAGGQPAYGPEAARAIGLEVISYL